MENHPIPQDITGFQFKLIGNMTVKQFAYLAAGVILAWISYILPFSLLFKLPLIILFVSLGIGFAFVPIDGRSMDVMFINLIRALFNPTKYLYQKRGGDLLKPSYVVSQPNPIQPQPMPQAAPQPAIQQAQQVTPISVEEKPTEEEMKQEEQLLTEQEAVLEEEIKESEPTNNNNQLLELRSMLDETIKQKGELEKELESLKTMLQQQIQATSAPLEPKPEPRVQPEIKQEQAIPTKDSLPEPIQDSAPPNFVKGSIKDPRGNPIFNVLVEVIDQEENPVRAFKTNEKGDFTSATSLPNGKYTIKFEDSKDEHKFDNISFETNGSTLPPFEIKSIDQREELRRELFN